MNKKSEKGKGVSKEKEKETPVNAEKETVAIEIKRDKLAEQIAKEVNKAFTGFKAVHFLSGPDAGGSAIDVKEWISTGDDILDIRISNRPHGGVPVGKLIEINGLPSSGKSLLVAHLIAETQKKGGIGILFDTEFAASQQFLEAIGVDTTNMLHVQLEVLEEIFEHMEKMIMQIRESYPDRLVMIAVDSIMGATTRIELESDYDKEGWATAKAIIMSKACSKLTALIAKYRICLVFTNQLRAKLGASFGEKYTTSGGYALGFHESVGIRLTKMGQLKLHGEVIGVAAKAKIAKNRVGPPLRECELNIYFDRGLDRFGSWLACLKKYGLATVSGGKKPMVTVKGGIEIPTKEWNETLKSNTELREKLYGMICDELIMKYKSADATAVDVAQETSTDED